MILDVSCMINEVVGNVEQLKYIPHNLETKRLLQLLFRSVCEDNINLIIEGTPYDLVFAYAINVQDSPIIQNFVSCNWNAVLSTNNLVLLKHSDLIYVEKEGLTTSYLLNIQSKEKRTIKRNTTTYISEKPFTEEFWQFWCDYSFKRFGDSLSMSKIDMFKLFFSQTNQVKLLCYEIENATVAYNVLFFEEDTKILHDMLFPWRSEYSHYRLGIYSIINNLQFAYKCGFSYSLCYGNYSYKRNVLRGVIRCD